MTAAQLAQEIRKAADHDTGALILEAIDAPEVQAAISDAESKGTAIVLLDAPLPSPSPGKIRPYVEFKGFTRGRQGDRSNGHRRSSFVFTCPPTDRSWLSRTLSKTSRTDDSNRLQALSRPLAATTRSSCSTAIGRPGIDSQVFDRPSPDHDLACRGRLWPDRGIPGARRKMLSESDRQLIVGGYGANDMRLDMSVKNGSPAGRSQHRGLYPQSPQAALDQMDGKPTPERNEVALPFTRNQPDHYPIKAEPKKTGPKDRAPESAKKPGPTAAPARK